MTKVMCSGTFDVIHPGHLHYLSESKKHGDELIVVVARDENSKAFKGKAPIHDERQRLEAVRTLRVVDKAILGRQGSIFDIISEINPDVICLGYDQKISKEQLEGELKKISLKAEVIRIGSHMPHVYKSSKIN